MTSSAFLDRLSLSRPGYRLIDVTDVGLPVFLVRADVLLLEHRPVGPLDEFVMKAIDHGFDTLREISGVLGLDEGLVLETLANLQRDDCIVMVPRGDQRVAQLTPTGAETLESKLRDAPTKEAIRVGFDRLTWRVNRAAQYNLMAPKDFEESGRLAIPPQRKRRVTTSDLRIEDIDREVRSLRSRGTKPTVLAVEWIVRAAQFFLPAQLAVFESISGGDAQLAVLIDGRVSDEHESALERLGGLDAIGATLAKPGHPNPTESLATDYGEEVAVELAAQAPSTAARDEAKRQRVTTSGDTDDGEGIEEETPTPHVESITTSAVEFIDTYEHRVYLDRALSETSKRLVIISPWIAAHVVNTGFLERLAQLLRKGVQVHIGYGLDQRPGDRAVSNADARAEQALINMAYRHDNFTLVRLGNTHSKQLLFDDTHVSGSFNWLSFQGSKGKEYRHEESTVVRIKSKVDKKYKDLCERLEAADSEAADGPGVERSSARRGDRRN